MFKWRNWCYFRITMTRKSGKCLHATYRALNSCFDLIRSHQPCPPWSPPLEIEPTTIVCRSRNSTTGPLVPAIYIVNCATTLSNGSRRYVFPTECSILTLDQAVNQEMHLCNSETGVSGRRYRNITLTCGHGWIHCRCVRPREASGCQTIL